MWLTRFFGGLLLLFQVGCGSDSTSAVVATYEARGVYMGSQYNGAAAVINHEPIPGFMEAMRMTFRLADSVSLATVPVGTKIQFELVVTEASSFIQAVHVLPDSTNLELQTHLPDAPDAGNP